MSHAPTRTGPQRRTLLIALITLLALTFALQVAPKASAAGTVVVKPSSMNGWVLLSDTPDAMIPTLVTGPTGAPLGSGSARLVTTVSSHRPMLATGAYVGTPLASLTSLEYQTYRTAPVTGVLAAALQFDVDFDATDANTGWQGRLVYEPYLEPAAVNSGGWQTWQPLTGRWWFSGAPGSLVCSMATPCAWATVLTTYPTASIRGATLFKAGSGWSSFDGNVDAFTIGISGSSTTFDFEPETACTTVCYVNATTGDDTFGGDTPASAKKTIQAAIDQVSAGGTVHVAAGTYAEQVTVSKSVDLTGAGAGVANIVAPGTIPVASNPDSTVVKISGIGVSVDLSGFTISGPGPSGCGSIGYGILVRDSAHADIHDNEILDIRDQPFSGCQNGVGIQVGRNFLGTSGTATITDNVISGFQKNGITVDGAGSSASIVGNTIVGAGPSTTIAQNGIQVSRAATSEISQNTINGNDYTPASYVACGLLFFEADGVKQSKNSLSGNEKDLCNFGRGGGKFNAAP